MNRASFRTCVQVSLLCGNIMHLDMSLDQMFMLRPLPELSTYRTPIGGLYLRVRERNWRGWTMDGALLGAAAIGCAHK